MAEEKNLSDYRLDQVDRRLQAVESVIRDHEATDEKRFALIEQSNASSFTDRLTIHQRITEVKVVQDDMRRILLTTFLTLLGSILVQVVIAFMRK